jgi:type IV fimbrial biogenesis protein FimT
VYSRREGVKLTVHREIAPVGKAACLLPARKERGSLSSRRHYLGLRKVKKTGFTLVELLVVIAITGILAALAVPFFQDQVARSAINSGLNTLLGDIQLARSQAIVNNTPTRICRSLTSNNAAPTCSPGSGSINGSTYAAEDWAAGWLVFVDVNNANGFDAGDILLKQRPPISPGSTARAVLWSSSTTGIYSYQGNGLGTGTTATFRADYLSPAPTTGNPTYSARRHCFTIAITGRIEMKTRGTC